MSALASIEDARVVYVEGFGVTTVGELRALRPEYITTEQAEEIFSYRRETWAGWAKDGQIEGARFDRMWRLPIESCREHIRRLTEPRRRRAPATTQAGRAWAADLPQR